jgi:hypothetical protein
MLQAAHTGDTDVYFVVWQEAKSDRRNNARPGKQHNAVGKRKLPKEIVPEVSEGASHVHSRCAVREHDGTLTANRQGNRHGITAWT